MFTRLDQDSYVEYLLQNLNQDQQARRMLLVDIYQIGQVLKNAGIACCAWATVSRRSARYPRVVCLADSRRLVTPGT